jgi:multidrug efflux system membrane fusion protein
MDENHEAGPPKTKLPAGKKPGFFSHWSVRLVLLLLILAGAYAFFKKRETPAGSEAGAGGEGRRRGGFSMANRMMPVAVATAKLSEIHLTQNGLGNVTPLATVTVKSRVNGQLMSVAFQEGQMVQQGEALAEIDPRPYQAALLQAQGQLEKDQAALKDAQLNLTRDGTLLAQKAATQQTYDTQAALVMQNEGAVTADQGTVNDAQLQIEYAHITAPIGGRTGLRQVDPGNIVQTSDSNGLVVITQMQPMGVVFTIPEDSLPAVLAQIHAGEKLSAEAFDRSFQTKLASGTLLTVDNQIDPSTGTVKLKATFPNEDNKLFPNQFVNIRLLVQTERNQIVIPTAAIQDGSQGEKFVYLVKPDQTVTVQKVTPGAVDGDNTAITQGVSVGQIVVIDGADKLREGAKVQVSAPGNGAATSGASPHAGAHLHHHQTS